MRNKKKAAPASVGKKTTLDDALLRAWANGVTGGLRDDIAMAVLQGLYSNLADAQKFAAYAMGETMPLPEAFTRIAYQQADEVLRLRAL